MKIICKKTCGINDKIWDNSIKAGLAELKNDWKDGEITIRADKKTVTLYPHTEYQKNCIMRVISNYAIPYLIIN